MALREPDVLWTFLLLAAIALVVVRPLARRTGRPAWVAAFALLSLDALLSVTLVPQGGWSQLGHAGAGGVAAVVECLDPRRWQSALTAWLRTRDGGANVLLFLPAGLLWGVLLRRPLVTVAGLAVLSLGIEVWQGATGGRACTSPDIVANVLGAAIGATIGVVVGSRGVHRPRPG